MMPFLRLFAGPAAAEPSSPPRPQTPICVIGDLHGMADLLEAMLDLIARQPGADRARIVLVGDLIDRGPDSARVLSRVRDLCLAEPARYICLMGNHERMLLDFLENPESNAARWLRAGGAETVQSLGLSQRMPGADPAGRFRALAEAVRAALPAGMPDWLAALPLFWQADGLTVVHADADPARPLTAQGEAILLWGRGKGRIAMGWIAHGHVIVAEPSAAGGRIRVDTGAWSSGRLSACWLDGQGTRFLQVGPIR